MTSALASRRLLFAVGVVALVIALACLAPIGSAHAQSASGGAIGLELRAKLQHDGWQTPVASGKVAGTKTKQGFRMMQAKLVNTGGRASSICYQTFVPGSGWSTAVKNGKSSGSDKRAITAARIWLKGDAADRYDVYYRVYLKGYGWFGWAKNGETAGTEARFWYVNALQVKLVKKGATAPSSTAAHSVKDRWEAIEARYLGIPQVKQILEVKHTGGTRANVVLRKKAGSAWKTVLSCRGYVGSAGIGKAREGSARTPSGDFGITKAFGIKANPGAKLPYVRITNDLWWCSDRQYYNQLINIKKKPHDCAGEHLYNIRPYYNYGLFFDYNTHPIRYGAGSAFFVHCAGGETYTAGCIAVSKANMVKIIRSVSSGARLCIYKK